MGLLKSICTVLRAYSELLSCSRIRIAISQLLTQFWDQCLSFSLSISRFGQTLVTVQIITPIAKRENCSETGKTLSAKIKSFSWESFCRRDDYINPANASISNALKENTR